ncbi:MAG: DUF4013 domain-containing protein [Methanobrevibacter sp.]|uniref:DUF4013 domain-containing protein n=1 Tax=Methanobrevibacter sp. TaxID=66852 RepID=UPI0025D1D6EA|nr:DUF4013 domain-containing protein [Methanobrevibacter sp.]MBR0272108.1 DUF4013 domain-containing protein [Methanobrevibacter sp.]
MDIAEIFKDSLSYPLHNIKSLVVFAILGIIAAIASGSTLIGILTGVAAENVAALLGSAFLGVIITAFIAFVISGYELDIVKYGIERSDESPSIDVIRQFFNGFKLMIVSIVYYIIPYVIVLILSIFFKHWVISVIAFILYVIFALAQFMAQCRLAKTEDLMDALAFGQAIADISRVGILKLLVFIIVVAIIAAILIFVATALMQWNTIVGGIILGIVAVYLVFFVGRATGLLYSEV